jgi:exopolysaccharide biosynthesis polyprenyl glycosylphosphotransferase
MFKLFNLYISQWKVLLIVGDAGCYLLSVAATLLLYPYTTARPWDFLYQHKIIFLLIGVTYFIVLFITDLYNYLKDFRQITSIVQVLIACWIGSLVGILIFYFPIKGVYLGRSMMIIQAVSFSILMAAWRFAFSAISLTQRLQKRLLIIGAGKAGRYLVDSIRSQPGCGFLLVGFVDDDAAKVGTKIDDLPVLGDSSHLAELIKSYQINLVVVAINRERSRQLIRNLIMVSWYDCPIIDMPTVYEMLTGKLPTDHISDKWIFDWSVNSSKIYYIRLKRLIDLALAGLVLLVSSPLMLVVALLIKLDSKGPVFFRQERLGQKGRPFNIIKFRTMFQGAENDGPVWTDPDDPRITRAGKLLRKLRLDELPQLLNILRGEMSFIGPRPLAHTTYMDQILFYDYRTLVKPGITGWAQVMFPKGLTIDSTQEKLKYDLYYIKNIGFLLDVAILLKTVRTVIFGHGV